MKSEVGSSEALVGVLTDDTGVADTLQLRSSHRPMATMASKVPRASWMRDSASSCRNLSSREKCWGKMCISGSGWSASKTVEEKSQYARRQVQPPVGRATSPGPEASPRVDKGSQRMAGPQRSLMNESEHCSSPRSFVSAWPICQVSNSYTAFEARFGWRTTSCPAIASLASNVLSSRKAAIKVCLPGTDFSGL